ncbi:autophagy-related protein 7 [Plasmodium brasilianum]|uniref:Autophagy-related protein 7, putative n=2 Tax=Plasmodium (Plasmodium) TaxID=418103 RepID=A0A1D3PCC5_PLAMA|nr:autophagy-related protein 7, putative [Plasmodium malariae]KAI4838383.1 autophagy-related protein 7 [Plasmodium brasilianum]SCN12781.1 autophagy-related protein 7, putative [Plasmodium malariae]
MDTSNHPNARSLREFDIHNPAEIEGVQILKHCYNEFKIDISFFIKLHEKKTNVYKLKSDYVNLISSTYVNKTKTMHKYNRTQENATITELEYPHIYVSTVEVNKKSFTGDEKYIEKEEEKIERGIGEVVKEAGEGVKEAGEGSEETMEEVKENYIAQMHRSRREIKINRYNKKYLGVLLNFNTLEEFLNAKRNEHINYALNDIRSYLKEHNCVERSKEGRKEESIYDDSFWEYKAGELNFFEKINKYLILSYLDLKTFICYYSIANPIIKPDEDYKLITPFERIFFYIDSRTLYLNNDKRGFNITDLLYLSYNIDTYFDNFKMFIKSNIFLLLKFDSNNNTIRKFNYTQYYSTCLYNMCLYTNGRAVRSKREKEFYQINNFKKLFEYLSSINWGKGNRGHMNEWKKEEWKKRKEEGEEKREDNCVSELCQNLDMVILPITCLSELKEDIKNSKDRVLKNIKKDIFDLYICVIDPNYTHNSLGWDFRNFLYFFSKKYELYNFEIDLLAFRDLSLLSDECVCKFNMEKELLWIYPIHNIRGVNTNNRDYTSPYVSNICKVNYTNINKNNSNGCINEYSTMKKEECKDRESIHTNNSIFVCMNMDDIDKSLIGKTTGNTSSFNDNTNVCNGITCNTATAIDSNATKAFEIINEKKPLVKYFLNSSIFKIKFPNKHSFEEGPKKLNFSRDEKCTYGDTDIRSINLMTNCSFECTAKLDLSVNTKLENREKSKDKNTSSCSILISSNSNKHIMRNNSKYEIISGWKTYEKVIHGTKKQSIIYVINLNDFLNKNTIQRISVELNIKLIKWKILKDLKFEKIKKLKILIIGLGTLGCMVARNCVSWGIQNFTFIDNARVSYSNVSRQYLYTIADAERYGNLGEYKCIAAKNNLLKISPDINITAKVMDIPMPGHLNYLKDKNIENKMKELDELIENHDVVFLLTDSKESRYFPCLLIAEKQYNCLKEIRKIVTHDTPKQVVHSDTTSDTNTHIAYTDHVTYTYHTNVYKKSGLSNEGNFDRNTFYNNILTNVKKLPKMPPLGITVAIGFDSFLVLRHSFLYFKAACYFCNDMHSPSDSLTYRTLDEKCTVTRSGISTISSAMSTELLISLTQHPLYFFAPHSDQDQYIYNYDSNNKSVNNDETKKTNLSNSFISCLGATPHILTFNLANFSIKKLFSHAFEKCLCCSENVISLYQEDKMDFIKNVISDSLVLERVTNIGQLKVQENDVILLD